MAIGNGNGKAVYATDEAGMMADAKIYAKQDFNQTLKVNAKLLNVEVETMSDEIKEKIAKALIEVKYEQIVEARTNRVTYFD